VHTLTHIFTSTRDCIHFYFVFPVFQLNHITGELTNQLGGLARTNLKIDLSRHVSARAAHAAHKTSPSDQQVLICDIQKLTKENTYVHTQVYLYIYVHICIYVHIYICIYMHISIYLYIHIFVATSRCLYVTYKNIQKNIHLCIHQCIRMCIQKHTQVYTHVHTRAYKAMYILGGFD